MSTTPAEALSTLDVPARREPLRLAPAWDPAAPTPPSRGAAPVTASAPSLPVAAVRLPGSGFDEACAALRSAGFGVLDILAQDVGPVPSVLVFELPDDDEALARLLAVARPAVGRVLITRDRNRLAGHTLRPGADEVVDAPVHPLQVAAAALRVSGTPEHRLARWSEAAFADLPAAPRR